MDEEIKKELAELKEFHELCKPIIEYLRKKFTALTNSAIIFKIRILKLCEVLHCDKRKHNKFGDYVVLWFGQH